MNVQLFSYDYPPNSGGISRLCAELAKHLQLEGVDVDVLTQRSSQPDPQHHYASVPTTRVQRQRPQRELAGWRALSDKADLVISGLVYPEALIASLRQPERHVILAHGAELAPHPNPALTIPWRVMKQRVLESADLVIANSRYTQLRVSQLAPMARVISLPLAVDAQRFSPGDRSAAREHFGIPQDHRVISTVSRVFGYKAHDLVIEAIAQLPEEKREKLLYIVAGRGPALEGLKELARARGVDEQIRWLGFVPEEDLQKVYHASDLFVLCTRDVVDQNSVEGFGLVFLEAQACGVPVIGARTGGIPDAIEEGRGGWLIEEDDRAALCAHLDALITDPERFAAEGARARQRVEDSCTWSHYTANMLRILERYDVISPR